MSLETSHRLPVRYYWILQCIGWGLYAIVGMAAQMMFVGFNVRIVGLISCGALILFTLTHLYRRYSKSRSWSTLSFGRLAWRILTGTFLMALVSQLIVSVLMVWVFDLLGDQRYSFAVLGLYVFQTQVILICWSLIYFSFHAFRNRQIEQVEKWKLQVALKEAELTALKAQINPHFIFNCLNNIRALVLENPEKSRDMITRLSDLLRYSIRLNGEPLVPLEKEVEIVKDYLALESIHYEERLRHSLDIDPATLECKVPPMSIQLLVENAIKHGISKLPTGGDLYVQTRLESGNLSVIVSNSGQLSEPPGGESSTGGIGLRNSQERLNLLFPHHCDLSIRNRDPQTVEASFVIPSQWN